MRFTYDPDVDALAVQLAPGRKTARLIKLGRGITADLDADGRLITVEVLDASHWYDRPTLEGLTRPGREFTLAEAVKESGLEASTLRRQAGAGKIPGAEKRGRDWILPEAGLWSYLEGREARGRRPATRKGRRIRKETAGAAD